MTAPDGSAPADRWDQGQLVAIVEPKIRPDVLLVDCQHGLLHGGTEARVAGAKLLYRLSNRGPIWHVE